MSSILALAAVALTDKNAASMRAVERERERERGVCLCARSLSLSLARSCRFSSLARNSARSFSVFRFICSRVDNASGCAASPSPSPSSSPSSFQSFASSDKRSSRFFRDDPVTRLDRYFVECSKKRKKAKPKGNVLQLLRNSKTFSARQRQRAVANNNKESVP